MLGVRLVIMLLLGWGVTAHASAERFAFETPAQEAMFQNLLKEVRCVTCPNQNILESNAPTANAIRQFIYEQIQKGSSEGGIRRQLADHYGEQVLYRPLWKKSTLLLWLGPVFLLGMGLGIWKHFFYRTS